MVAYFAYLLVVSFIVYIVHGVMKGKTHCRAGVIAAAAIVAFAAAAGCFAEAAPEEEFDEVIIEVTGVKPVIIGDEILLEVVFNYDGEELSWFEDPDDIFDVKVKYLVKIYLPGKEVIDANPYGGWLFYFLRDGSV